MRNKKKKNLQPPSPHPSLLSGLNFTPHFLSLLPPSGAGGRGMAVVVITHGFCCSFLLMLFPAPVQSPTHGRQSSMNFSNMSPSHGLQLFMNWSCVGPFHRVQYFRHRLLQCGSPTGSPFLPRACSSVGSPWGHRLLWASTCSRVGSSMGCRWISAPQWTSMVCRGTTCLTMVFIMSCRVKISAPAPEAPPPPPSSQTLVSAELFLSHSLTPLSWMLLSSSIFPPFLNMLSQRCYHPHWWAQPRPAAGLSWIQLALAL